MKSRILIVAAFYLLLSVALGAQVTTSTASITSQARGPANVAGLLYAANFAHWTVSPSDMGTRWNTPAQCIGTSGGVNFRYFSTNAPITIVDLGVPANTETLTPTQVGYQGSGCNVSLPATHPHSNYYLQSGTIGLAEAINFAGSTNSVIVLTPDWSAMGGTTAMITAARPGANTSIVDQRTATVVPYTGSTPVANATLTAARFIGANTASCVVGAASGAGATCACATNHVCTSSSGVWTVNTGTGTTTGTALTVTLYSTAQASYPNCVVESENTTAISTVTYTAETSTGFTRQAFSAPAASTVYTVHYDCGY